MARVAAEDDAQWMLRAFREADVRPPMDASDPSQAAALRSLGRKVRPPADACPPAPASRSARIQCKLRTADAERMRTLMLRVRAEYAAEAARLEERLRATGVTDAVRSAPP